MDQEGDLRTLPHVRSDRPAIAFQHQAGAQNMDQKWRAPAAAETAPREVAGVL